MREKVLGKTSGPMRFPLKIYSDIYVYILT